MTKIILQPGLPGGVVTSRSGPYFVNLQVRPFKSALKSSHVSMVIRRKISWHSVTGNGLIGNDIAEPESLNQANRDLLNRRK